MAGTTSGNAKRTEELRTVTIEKTIQKTTQTPVAGTRRMARLVAGALIALGVAGGGSLGLTAVAYADSGQSVTQDSKPAPAKSDRGVKTPVSAPALTNSAVNKAQKLQRPGHPLVHLGLAAD